MGFILLFERLTNHAYVGLHKDSCYGWTYIYLCRLAHLTLWDMPCLPCQLDTCNVELITDQPDAPTGCCPVPGVSSQSHSIDCGNLVRALMRRRLLCLICQHHLCTLKPVKACFCWLYQYSWLTLSVYLTHQVWS